MVLSEKLVTERADLIDECKHMRSCKASAEIDNKKKTVKAYNEKLLPIKLRIREIACIDNGNTECEYKNRCKTYNAESKTCKDTPERCEYYEIMICNIPRLKFEHVKDMKLEDGRIVKIMKLEGQDCDI